MLSESSARYISRAALVETCDAHNLRKALLSLDPSSIEPLLKSISGDDARQKFIISEAIPSLLKTHSSGSAQTQRIVSLFLKRILIALDNDDFTLDLITRNATNSDPHFRTLAVSLIPLVKRPTKLEHIALSLALERVPSVKCQFIKCLHECKFEPHIVDTVLKNAANDRNPQVRLSVTDEIPRIAPHLVREFSSLLTSEDTVDRALNCLSVMVEANGFKPFLGALSRAITLKKEQAASAVLKSLSFMRDDEHDSVLAMLSAFAGSITFLRSLADVARHFDDKESFAKFVAMNGVKFEKWRDRMIVLEQSLLLVKDMRGDLLPAAVAFANDDVAVIRSKSVELWIEMIECNPNMVEYLEMLLSSNWQTRMVAAKVIGAVGFVSPVAEELAERLKRDEAVNVRHCLASSLSLELARRMFKDTEDEQIRVICKI